MNTPTDLRIAMACVTVNDDVVHLNIARHRPAGRRQANRIWARINEPFPEMASQRDFLIFHGESEDDSIPLIEVRNPISKVPATPDEVRQVRQAVAEWVCLNPEVLLRAMIEFHESGCEAGASQSDDVRYALSRIYDLLGCWAAWT